MKASLIRRLFASMLALVLAACGGGDQVPDDDQSPDETPAPPSIEVGGTVGTYNPTDLDVPGTYLSFVFQDESAQGENANFWVTGPSGWNNDEPLTFEYPIEASVPEANYFVYYYFGYDEGESAVSGQYNLTVTYRGQTYTFTPTLDASSTMPLPEPPTMIAVNNSEITYSVPDVPEAPLYVASILTSEDFIGGIFSYEPIFRITDLMLQPGVAYYALAQALNVDVFTVDPSTFEDTQVNVSESFVEFTLE